MKKRTSTENPQRDSKGRWQPGRSGNPTGRGRASGKTISAHLRELLKLPCEVFDEIYSELNSKKSLGCYTLAHLAACRMLIEAFKPGASPRLIAEVLNRVDGKVR